MNSYPAERKHNVPLETLKHDINMVFNAIDSFGVVNVFGGETFLHPQISEIIEEILKYDSYGSVIVNTNGTAKMTDENLLRIKNPRVRLAFSNYTQALGENKLKSFRDNVEKARRLGLTVGVQNELPTWNVSSTLSNNDVSQVEMIHSKEKCGVKFLYVLDGKVFPCAFCLSLYDLGVANYEYDYVDISKCKDAVELRKKIIEMLAHPYNMSCRHCDQDCKTTSIAGEQGFDPRYELPAKENMIK